MNQIKFYRKKAGLTQGGLAEKLGFEQSTISNYENGRRMPELDVCRSLVAVFCDLGIEIGLDDLFPVDQETDAA